MDGRLQLRVQRYGWDRASARYEDLWRETLAPASQGVLRLARLQPGERVLDVATTIDYVDATTACDAAFEGGPVALACGRFDTPPRRRARRVPRVPAALGPLRRFCSAG